MSTFELPHSTAVTSPPGSRAGKPGMLQHRSSDPEFSDTELDDAVDMGEHAVWANLGEPIYAAKDLEVFRPPQKQSTLPMYYVKGWLPFSADTLFNALLDARYRMSWDSNVAQVHVVDRQPQGDVLYFALNLPWPLANRDYVYMRRTKFCADHNAFVMVYHASHHSGAPENGARVRVETCTLRMCIRSASGCNDACDFHVEYEDDTNFSVPNYVVNLLLHTMVPTFMAELRAACDGYAAYIKMLDDNGVQTIPSQVVRHRSDDMRAAAITGAAASALASTMASESSVGDWSEASGSTRGDQRPTPRSRRGLFFTGRRKKRGEPGLLPRRTDERSGTSASDDRESSSYEAQGESLSQQRVQPLLSSSDRSRSLDVDGNMGRARNPGHLRVSAHERLGHSSSATNLYSNSSFKASPIALESSQSDKSGARRSSFASGSRKSSSVLQDDFTVKFRQQKVGLHLETDVLSKKVLVSFCEQGSEAAMCRENIEPGLVVTSVNGVPIGDSNLSDVLSKIECAPRPLTLGFTSPARAGVSHNRSSPGERPSVFKCLVSRDSNDLLRVLRPMDNDAAVGAVLNSEFTAATTSGTPPSKGTLANNSSEPVLKTLPPSITKPRALTASQSLPSGGENYPSRVTIPEGYLIYEIDDCCVVELPYAEIAHLLRRNGDARVVTFKATSRAAGGTSQSSIRPRRSISKRISGAFKWRGSSSMDLDSSVTGSTCSSSSREWGSERSAQVMRRVDKPASLDTCKDRCLVDYSTVAVTAANVEWVWQHVKLLKTTERIFSAALLIERLEAFLAVNGSTDKAGEVAKTKVQRAMREEQELLDGIKQRRNQGVDALKEFNSSEDDDEWQFGQTLLGVTTSWKPDPNGSVWIKLEGDVDGVDIFNTISVIREVDLYSVWTPFCSQSLLLQDLGHVELVAYLAISSPFLARDTVIRAFGINACYENRCLLLLGGSVDESTVPSSVEVPTLRGWSSGRMEIRGFRALIEPITRMKARTCIVANIDPKCAIPKAMLNFGVKKMAGILLYLIRKEAEKIEHAHEDRAASAKNEHLRRIKSDPSGFYTWLRPIVDRWFEDQKNDRLPPPLPLTDASSGQLEWTTTADGTLVTGSSNSRTSSPRLAKMRSSNRIAAFRRQASGTSMTGASSEITSIDEVPSASKRVWSDYLHDFTIWPYVLLFLFAKLSVSLPFLQACVLKFIFTCSCTWLGVPGAFPRATRHWKRAQQELEPLRRQCVVLAAILDVVSSWAMRTWVRFVQCYATALLFGPAATAVCFARSPSEVRETEQFWLVLSCFTLASVVVGVQVVANL